MYTQTEPSQGIEFGKVGVEFDLDGQTRTADATVALRFTPEARLTFVVQVGDPLAGLMISTGSGEANVRLINRNVTIQMHCAGSTAFAVPTGQGCTLILAPRQSFVQVTPPTGDLRRVDFHLFNFPDFAATSDYLITKTGADEQTSSKRCGRVILHSDGWTIAIAADDRTDECCKQLKACGGYMITHMGRIERDDGSSFSSEQAEECLYRLHTFLSFALDRWAGVALPVGFDAQGQRVFEQWGPPLVDAGKWNGSLSWFDESYGQVLSQVLPGFWRLWNAPLWSDTIWTAVYWYVRANAGGTGSGIDAGLILAQVALERLAWTYCVRDRKLVSKDAFGQRGLRAADRLRLLATTMGIPVELPACMVNLKRPSGANRNDVCDAVTAIRNELIHPKVNFAQLNDWYVPAWRTSIWLLDLVLLRLCGHNGKYANRLTRRWVGQVEPVPWAGGQV